MNHDWIYPQIGELIRRRRKQLKMTQEQLAPIVGISRASLANVETGRQKVLVHQLFAMAEALGLAPVDLLPGARIGEAASSSDIPMPSNLSQQQKEQISRLLSQPMTTPKGGKNVR